MSTKRFQASHPYEDGNWWRLRFYEDVLDEHGQIKRHRASTVLGPCAGPKPMKEKQAQRAAAAFLKTINATDVVQGSLMKVSDFVERRFLPEYVLTLKRGGQEHYRSWLKHVDAGLGAMSLRDVKHEHVQRLCLNLLEKTYTIGKKKPRHVRYSVQSALHLRNAISALFDYADTAGLFNAKNPADKIRLPEMIRKEKRSLTYEQMRVLLEALPPRAGDVAHFLVLTSMNIAELCGLRWRCINMTSDFAILGTEPIPAMSLVVREQWTNRKGGGRYGTVKAASRQRTLPLDDELLRILRSVAGRKLSLGPDDPVFCNTVGNPIDAKNLFNRHLKPIARKLGMPWIGWHTFRHTFATWYRQDAKASVSDQVAGMGHADARMTMRYGQQDLVRRREAIARMSQGLAGSVLAASGVAN